MGAPAQQFIDALKQFSGAILDAYVVLDSSQRIVDFNGLFFGLFPRSVARGLKQTPLGEVLTLELEGSPIDLAQKCVSESSTLRYDEVVGQIKDAEPISLIVAASPLVDQMQEVIGTVMGLRNVTDEAQVQLKYKTMLEHEAREREILQQRIQDAEAELVTVKDQLNGIEAELRNYKKGLLL